MSMAQIAGKTAFLPMDPYEMEKFLYDLGLDGPGAEHQFEFVGGFYDGYRIDWGMDFRLANRLAQQISDMGDRREDFRAWCCAQEHCTAADALRASYHMNTFMFLPGMCDDEILGEFALDNELIEEYNDLPDEIYEALDKAKAGAKMREQEGGVFVNEGYLLEGEDFSGEPIPEDKPAFFQLRFSDSIRDSGWCDVPLSADDDSRIAVLLEQDPELEMECRSIIPQLSGMISGAVDMPELCLLNEALTGMSGEEIQKYKALLEAIKPEIPNEALRLANEMDLYEVEMRFANPAVYGRQSAERMYHLGDVYLLRFIDFAGYGAEMLKAEGYESTRYGAVYRNAMAMKLLSGPDTVYSGDCYCGRTEGFPTNVCWDPDARKVWLELNDYAADSELVKDFAYYQGICEDWGVRHCASQEDYEQVLSALGAQPYDEAMADDQNFGGMGGMA